eukprot:745243-Amphidinium_carterae.2
MAPALDHCALELNPSHEITAPVHINADAFSTLRAYGLPRQELRQACLGPLLGSAVCCWPVYSSTAAPRRLMPPRYDGLPESHSRVGSTSLLRFGLSHGHVAQHSN